MKRETSEYSLRRKETRRRARVLVLQALYQADIRQSEMAEDALDQLLEEGYGDSQDVDRDYVYRVTIGAWERREEIDQIIGDVAEKWSSERLAVVDRNILRLGLFELLAENTLPTQIIINEAIELGKKFGDKGSHSFINGIMDKAAARIRQHKRSSSSKRRRKRGVKAKKKEGVNENG
ncbi:transcription antitermination factor NusB [Magnetococcales bacterium HHB-1]